MSFLLLLKPSVILLRNAYSLYSYTKTLTMCFVNLLSQNPKGFDFFLIIVIFLGLQVWHMEVPRLGAELELQLPAYTTATAMQDQSCVCDLHHSSRQHWILNPLSEARDQTCTLMVTSRVCNRLSHKRNSCMYILKPHMILLLFLFHIVSIHLDLSVCLPVYKYVYPF